MAPLSLALLRSKGSAPTWRWSHHFPASSICTYYQVHLLDSNAFIPILLSILRLPTSSSSSINLNHYVAFLARSLSASSIPAYLNAIRILPVEHGLTDPTKNNYQLASTLRGIKRVKGLTVSQKKPITPEILLTSKSHLNLDNPLHATFWAVCLVAFFSLYVRRICLAKD